MDTPNANHFLFCYHAMHAYGNGKHFCMPAELSLATFMDTHTFFLVVGQMVGADEGLLGVVDTARCFATLHVVRK